MADGDQQNHNSDFLPPFDALEECDEVDEENLQECQAVWENKYGVEMEEESGGSSGPMFQEANYDLDMLLWIKNGWRMYKEHWFQYSLLELFFWVLLSMPFVPEWVDVSLLTYAFPLDFSYLLAWPLQYGYFIVGSHLLRSYAARRQGGVQYLFQFKDLFRGYLLYFPLLWLAILWGLSLALGFVLCIIPGIYLAVTLAFGSYVYIEYHHMNNTGVAAGSFGVFDALVISRRLVHKNFCTNLLFFIIYFLVCLAGALCFGVGLLVARPVMELAMVFAFHDQFKLLPHRDLDRSCFCCC
ncbi:DUF996 domain-containing protein [Balamuthia mandrillaris]